MKKEDDQYRNRFDEAPQESRFRRVQQGVPPSGRVLPGMPLEMEDPEDGDSPSPGKPRFSRDYDAPRGPWWRPATTLGQTLLGIGVLTALVGLGAASYSTHNFLAHDARFRIAGVSNIEAEGLSEVTRADLLPIFGEDVGKNVFFVHLSERRQQLEQIPWVERATVMRLLPDRIRVKVVERQPVAFVRQGSQIELVDASGVLLSMPAAMMAQRHYSFPVVTGVDSHDTPAARRQRMEVYGRLIAELDANGQAISKQISEIDLTDPEDARVMMPEATGDILAHFGDDSFLDRYQRYKAHIAEWLQQYPNLSAVDLRYEQQVVLEMKPGAGDNQTIASVGSPEAAKIPAPTAETAARAGKPEQPQESKPAKPAATKSASAAVRQPAPTKPLKTTAKPVKATGKPGKKSSTKTVVKPAHKAIRETAAEKVADKKRAQAKPAMLNHSNRRHAAPSIRPALDPVLGQ